MPFLTCDATVRTADGRNVTLIEPLVYVTNLGETITIPAGTQSDGASVPSQFWQLVPPFGRYWLPSILHDYLYRYTQRSKSECDAIFLAAMRDEGVPQRVRDVLYEAVHVGGWWAFNKDRAKQGK